jgi:hypothetical protein
LNKNRFLFAAKVECQNAKMRQWGQKFYIQTPLSDVKFYIEHVKFYTFSTCPFYAVLSANNTAAKEENWGKTE